MLKCVDNDCVIRSKYAYTFTLILIASKLCLLIMKHGILIIGSSNTEMVIQTEHLPVPGETILGGTFFMAPAVKALTRL